MLFSRDDVRDALRDLITELHTGGVHATLRIVGGGAMALRHSENRALTSDVDALEVSTNSESAVKLAIEAVAADHGWPNDWFNFHVAKADAEPRFGNRGIEWETLYDRDGVVVLIADASSMLAMKLPANRPGRDTDDLRQLLAICGVTSVDAADEFYGEFYPGDSLSNRAWRMVTNILAEGPLTPADRPKTVDLSRESD